MSWLLDRLDSAKRTLSPRWADFALAVEEFWEEVFDDNVEYLKSLLFVVTGSTGKTDLENLGKTDLITSLPRYFEEKIRNENQVLAVKWQRLEVATKDTTFFLINSILRTYPTAQVDWLPLWALKSEAYGTRFFPKDDIPEGQDAFLTSRGRLLVNAPTGNAGEISSTLRLYANSVRPADVVLHDVVLLDRHGQNIYIGSHVGQGEKNRIFPHLTLRANVSPIIGAGMHCFDKTTVGISGS